jgi:hypothetical protein
MHAAKPVGTRPLKPSPTFTIAPPLCVCPTQDHNRCFRRPGKRRPSGQPGASCGRACNPAHTPFQQGWKPQCARIFDDRARGETQSVPSSPLPHCRSPVKPSLPPAPCMPLPHLPPPPHTPCSTAPLITAQRHPSRAGAPHRPHSPQTPPPRPWACRRGCLRAGSLQVPCRCRACPRGHRCATPSTLAPLTEGPSAGRELLGPCRASPMACAGARAVSLGGFGPS